MKLSRLPLALLGTLLLLASIGCAERSWGTSVALADGKECRVDVQVLDRLRQEDDQDGVPVDRVLWDCGARVVGAVEVGERAYDWRESYAATWSRDGSITLAGERVRPDRLTVRAAVSGGQQAPVVDDSTPSLTQVAPTVARALGLELPGPLDGEPLFAGRSPRVAILFLDGFGYLAYEAARERGEVPNLASLPAPRVATTVYPSVTAASSATLLTGLRPERHGATDSRIRSTKSRTIVDAAAAAGLRVVAVEGQALAFSMRSTEPILSSDRDGDGEGDDEIADNALREFAAGPPDLVWVHFHGIDDVSHTYGPASAEARERIHGVDAAAGRVLSALPKDTLVIIVADHGQHAVQEEGRLGNHGSLMPEDVLVPLWVLPGNSR
jgi:hypothetical protein